MSLVNPDNVGLHNRDRLEHLLHQVVSAPPGFLQVSMILFDYFEGFRNAPEVFRYLKLISRYPSLRILHALLERRHFLD